MNSLAECRSYLFRTGRFLTGKRLYLDAWAALSYCRTLKRYRGEHMDEKQLKQQMFVSAMYKLAPRIDENDWQYPDELGIADTEENKNIIFGAALALGVDEQTIKDAVIKQKIADLSEPDPNEGMNAHLLDEDRRKLMDNGDGP